MQQRVCEATIETLCEIGFDRLSLATVAERAGISRGAITHHFKTKTDILVGAFEYSIGRFKAERARFVAEYKNPTAEDFIRFVWRQNFSQPNYIASIDLMLAARADAELQRRIKDLFREWLGVRDVLNQEIFGEEIGGIPRHRYVELIYSAMRGIAVISSIDPDGRNNDLLIEDLIKITKAISAK
ncbi:TetR/AcrR family transcriptional regulator [Sinorhizobium fredii]|nr:TetR/AcrR family transcriptional regulator [Sinorhizobium fredii]AWI58387.1 hypothetical protein AB395_00002736 [Sinorhizobium fredii CCBAU 45436]